MTGNYIVPKIPSYNFNPIFWTKINPNYNYIVPKIPSYNFNPIFWTQINPSYYAQVRSGCMFLNFTNTQKQRMVDICTRHLGLYWVATDKLEDKNMDERERKWRKRHTWL